MTHTGMCAGGYWVTCKQWYLVLDGLPVLGVAHHRQLQLRHLLHLAVHVYLLKQASGLALQQPDRVLLPMLLCKEGCARRVYGSDPVFQICLASSLGT